MARKKKSNSEPFLLLPRRTLRSQELNSLTVHARWIYIILGTEWKRNGENKKFILTYRQIQKITGFDRRRIASALKELIEAGFVIKENHGGLLRNPNEYILDDIWLSINESTHGNNNYSGCKNVT